jgi:hypothetical protein
MVALATIQEVDSLYPLGLIAAEFLLPEKVYRDIERLTG